MCRHRDDKNKSRKQQSDLPLIYFMQSGSYGHDRSTQMTRSTKFCFDKSLRTPFLVKEISSCTPLSHQLNMQHTGSPCVYPSSVMLLMSGLNGYLRGSALTFERSSVGLIPDLTMALCRQGVASIGTSSIWRDINKSIPTMSIYLWAFPQYLSKRSRSLCVYPCQSQASARVADRVTLVLFEPLSKNKSAQTIMIGYIFFNS